MPLARMVYDYSLDKPTPRAAFARELPRGLQGRDLGRWATLLKVAAGVLAGRVKNPAPGATHFGSPSAALPDHVRAERMIAEGQWYEIPARGCANRFYGELPWASRPRSIAAETARGRR